MSTVLLDTTDLAEAEAALSANFSKMQLKGDFDAPTSLRIDRQFVGSVGIDSADYACEFSYAMDPPEQILVCRVVSGRLEAGQPQQTSVRCAAGDVYAFGAVEGAPYSGHVRPGHYDHLIMDRSLLSSVAAGHPGADGPVRLTESVSVSPEATRRLFKGIEYARRVAVSGDADANPLLASGLEQYLARLLLNTFPSTALLEPTTQDHRDSTPVLLRRAMAYIDDNAHTDISLNDISTAIYVTPRALQYMFRKHRDCTPMEYARLVRLGRAHLDLLGGHHSTTTVSTVARRWGFGHVGRFAVYYRQHYGKSPHVTLRSNA